MQNSLTSMPHVNPVTDEELVGVEWISPERHHRGPSVMYLSVGKQPRRSITVSAAGARFFTNQGYQRTGLRFSTDGRFVAVVADATGSLLRRTHSYQAVYQVQHDLPSGLVVPLSMVQGGLLVGRLPEAEASAGPRLPLAKPAAPTASVGTTDRSEPASVAPPAPPTPPHQPRTAATEMCLVVRLNKRQDRRRGAGSRLTLSAEAGRFFINMGFRQLALRLSADGNYVSVMRDPGGVTIGNTNSSRARTTFSSSEELVEETIPLSMIKGGILVGRLTRKEP